MLDAEQTQRVEISEPAPARLMPRRQVPTLQVETLSGRGWDIDDRPPAPFSMVVFYRGYHCPVCSTYIKELDRLVPEFLQREIDVLAISSDTGERAALSRSSWRLENLDLGYGLAIPKARKWGLYVSASRGKSTNGIEEPEVFSEPGIFIVQPNRTLYWASYSTMPFARPHFNEILQAFDFVKKLDYPARGEL